MKKILGENLVEEMLKSKSSLFYEDEINVKTKIVVELIKKVVKKEIVEFGKVLTYNIDKEILKKCVLHEDNNFNISLVIIKTENKILFVEAEEADSFYGYLKMGDTLGYIEDNKVWLRNYSRRVEALANTKDEMDALGLIFINEMNFIIQNEVKEYINNNFESYIKDDECQKKISDYMSEIRDNFEQNNFSLLKKLDEEYMCSGNKNDCTFDEKLKYFVEKSMKELISKMTSNILNQKEYNNDKDFIVNLFIDNKDKFWEIISCKIKERLLKKYCYEYSLIKRDMEDFKNTKKEIPTYNLIKEYNLFIYDLKTEINNIIMDKCKTMTVELKNNSFKTDARVYISEQYMKIASLYVFEGKHKEYILDPRDIKPFKIISRKKVIYELSEININKLKEYVNQFKNIGFEI